MTGPRSTPRSSPFLNPSTPKSRPSKSKPARPRSSPSQRRASPNISASTAAVVSNAAAAAAAAAAIPTPQQASAQQYQVQMAMQQMQQADQRKRAHSSIGTAKEPDQKRAKQTASAASSITASREPNRQPSSPTTSSRSRQRKPSKTRSTVSDGDSSPALAVSALTSVNAQRPRPPSRARTPNPRAPPLPQQTSCFSVEGTPFIPSVRPTSLQRRLFGHEIQCLMHAFGEVRYCARDVLEMTEDSVRDAVTRIAILAHEYAVEEAVAAENAGHIPVSKEVSLEIRHIAMCLKRDVRALQRLNLSLKHSAELHPDMISEDYSVEYKFTHTPKPWETIAELANVTPNERTVLPMDKTRSNGDIISLCSWRAYHAFRAAMTRTHFQDFAECRRVTLVRQKSQSRAPTIRDQPRITLFREWINASQKLSFPIPDHTLFALGHVAWEAVGLITQTALLHRHFDDLAKGFGDPRATNWSYPRHLVAALNYGLVTAIMVPITDIQAIALQQEVETYLKLMQVAPQKWQGFSQASSPCLLPRHIREALRRIERSPDSIFGFGNKSFLSSTELL